MDAFHVIYTIVSLLVPSLALFSREQAIFLRFGRADFAWNPSQNCLLLSLHCSSYVSS
jgi:hypothetical protein